MKSMKSILTSVLLITLFGLSAAAQSNTKVIAVINEADWCSVCKNNGERAMQTFQENNKDAIFQFVKNNLTNDDTKLASNEELKKFGLDSEMKKYNGTGIVYFFNAESKELISFISISKSNEELSAAMLSAQKENTAETSKGGSCE